jgi:hypothetical protein
MCGDFLEMGEEYGLWHFTFKLQICFKFPYLKWNTKKKYIMKLVDVPELDYIAYNVV